MQPAHSKQDYLINNRTKNNSSILSNIFKNDKNISIWRRELDTLIINAAKNILKKNSQLQFSEIVNPENVEKKLNDIEHKNNLLSEKLNFDFLDILIREKLKYGHSEEVIIKLNE